MADAILYCMNLIKCHNSATLDEVIAMMLLLLTRYGACSCQNRNHGYFSVLLHHTTYPAAMHILLTGSSGRIGSHILRLLLDEGHSVFAVDVTPLPDEILTSLSDTHKSRLEHRAVDLADIESIEALFERGGKQYDGLIHFGSIPSPNHDDPRVVHNNNVTGTYNILWTAAHKGKVKRMCQASSVNAVGMSFTKDEHWGMAYVPIDEKEPVRPVRPYPLTCLLHGAEGTGRSL